MKDDLCRITRRLLVDAEGSEEGLPAESLRHLRSCPECASFASLLGSLSRKEAPGAASADYRRADLALEEAGKVSRRRSEYWQFALFLGAALAIMSLFCLAGLRGYAVALIAIQSAAFLALPFVGLLAIRNRLKGGAPWIA